VDQAKQVFHNRRNVELNGRIVYVDFAPKRTKELSEFPANCNHICFHF